MTIDGAAYLEAHKVQEALTDSVTRCLQLRTDDPIMTVAALLTERQIRSDIEQLVRDKGCGPILIRLNWHDAGVYSTGALSGGCPNAVMRYTDGGEGTFGANAGLPTVAVGLLAPLANKYVATGKISHADLWTLAANVSIECMGGPKIPTRFGRVDAKSSAESVESQVGRLPDGDKGVQHLREIFHPKGFDDKDIVALSGAHTVGKCHADRSGFDGQWTQQHLLFDNSYYADLLTKSYTAETTSKGCQQVRRATKTHGSSAIGGMVGTARSVSHGRGGMGGAAWARRHGGGEHGHAC